MMLYANFDPNLFAKMLPFAVSYSRKFKAKHPVCDEFDLEAAAIDAIAEVIAKRDPTKNFGSYFRAVIWGRMRDVLRRTIGPTHSEHYRRRHGVSVATVQMKPAEGYDQIELLCGQGREPDPLAVSEGDVVEHISRRLAERDREILALRLRGHTFREIGERLGHGEAWAHWRWQAVRDTVRQLMDKEARAK